MKLKKFSITISLMVFLFMTSFPVLAQEAEAKKPEYGWKNEMVGNLNFTQTNFDNWTQGGEDTLAWQLNLNGKALKSKEKYNWNNSGKVAYGRSQIGDLGSRKSVDEVKLETVFTYLLGTYVNPYAAASGETQFTAGYNYSVDPEVEISNFIDPGYFSQSAGVGYEPMKELKTRLGFALHETVASDYAATYTDDPDTTDEESMKIEPGLESVTDFSKTLLGGILLTSKLEMFSNFKAFNEIDVKWDNIFSAKISKYIDVNLNIKLVYNRDVSLKRQLKQSLAVGLTYSFL